jgi:hypothetical protein
MLISSHPHQTHLRHLPLDLRAVVRGNSSLSHKCILAPHSHAHLPGTHAPTSHPSVPIDPRLVQAAR